MASNSLPNSPTRHTNSNAPFTPATLRRNGEGRQAQATSTNVELSTRVENVTRVNLSSLTTAALVGVGLAAVEAARLALVHEALGGVFADGGGALPFATVLTVGLGALDAGLLLRMFTPAGGEANSVATWAAVGAWLVSAVANSTLAMYAVAGMIDASHQLADVAPAAVAIVLLLLRVFLVGVIAWDRKAAPGA